MPESNDDPPSHSPPPAAADGEASAAPAPQLPLHLPPAPRANPPTVYQPKDAPPAGPAPAGFDEFVSWMQSIGGPPSGPAPSGTPDGRILLPKEKKKFRKFDPDAYRDNDKSAVISLPAEENAGAGRGMALRGDLPPPALTLEEVPVARKRKLLSPGEGMAFRFPFRTVAVLALLAGSFALGRKTAPGPSQVFVRPVAHTVSELGEKGTRAIGFIDQAMAAEAKHDYPQAVKLLQQAQKEDSHVTGIDYHLALLAFESGDFPHVLSLLNRSIDAGEEVAASYNLRGVLSNRTSGLDHGLADLETATRVDPYSARDFYVLGEALRRGGRPQAASVALSRAVNRLRESALEGVYNLKLHLTQIELGQENEFAGPLAEQLRLNPTPLDWLFTAAAVEMHHSRFDAAAGYLDKASSLTDASTMESRLRDYFFFAFAHEKPLARFYAAINKAEAVPVPTVTPPPAPALTLSPNEPAASPTPGVSPKP